MATASNKLKPNSDSEDSDPETELSSDESESDSDIDVTNYCEIVLESDEVWEEQQTLRVITFLDTPGLLVPIPGKGDPVDYFNIFLDDELLNFVCEQTNKTAVELMCQPGVTLNSRITHWKDVTVEEMRIFVGIVLHTGTIQLHRLNDYWRTDRLFNVSCFRQNMARNRFLLILKCLSFSKDGTDHYTKVKPLLDHYNNKMSLVYTPGRHLTLDEPMILWRGRLYTRQQFVKKNKYAMKIYMLSEPDGLVMKYHVHHGLVDNKNIALTLLDGRLDRGHSVYIDKCYTSVDLARILLERNTHCTGLLNRKNPLSPAKLLQTTLRRGENMSVFSDGLHVGKWKRKKDVYYVTSEHDNSSVITYINDNVKKERPTTFAKNKHYMTAIDRQEQLTSHYPCSKKNLRYTKKIFIHLLQVCLFTSHKLYNRASGSMNWYEFRLSVIGQLMHKIQFELKGALPTTHKLTKIEEIVEERKQLASGKFHVRERLKRKECKQCKKNKVRRQTTYHCLLCTGFPGLCPQCFSDYHENSLRKPSDEIPSSS